MFKHGIGSIALLGVLLFSSGALHAQPDESNGPDNTVLMRTSMGDLIIELDAERAPASVKNFLAYADDGFYTDTLFHRVIDGFMIQGGGYTGDFQRKATRAPVSNEAYNGLRNRRYTIAMARTTAPHSATSQFFINTENNTNLDHTGTTQRGWGYTVFGRVIDGMEVVDAISQVRTGSAGPFGRDVPREPVVILGVERFMPTAPTGSGTGQADKPNGGPAIEPEDTLNKVLAPADDGDASATHALSASDAKLN